MTDLGDAVSVTRWRRYGKDRLYVTAGDGSRVGWWDVASATAHPASPDQAELLDRAIAGWLADGNAPVPVLASSATAVDAVPEPAPRIDAIETDLALNLPGAMARLEAESRKERSRVRAFFRSLLGVPAPDRSWRVGADGEVRAAKRFEKVVRKDPRWRFLHAVPVGDRGSDIDHVAVGPGGVFTINTKHHPRGKVWIGGDTLLLNGHRQPYVRNSRHEARRASRLLSDACGFPVHVTPLLVLVGVDKLTVRDLPADVQVVPVGRVPRWFAKQADLLPLEAVEAIFAAARRPSTWRP